MKEEIKKSLKFIKFLLLIIVSGVVSHYFSGLLAEGFIRGIIWFIMYIICFVFIYKCWFEWFK